MAFNRDRIILGGRKRSPSSASLPKYLQGLRWGHVEGRSFCWNFYKKIGTQAVGTTAFPATLPGCWIGIGEPELKLASM